MICIATIVIVLLYEDGKPLDQWSLMISPNAVISFIAALAKSSCILVLAEVIGQLRWIRFTHQPCELNDLQVRIWLNITLDILCGLKLRQIYDEASRGPWGALKLILRSRNAALLASCASLLTVAALLIDPFSQLVLTFPTRAISSLDQVASISIAEAFDDRTEEFEYPFAYRGHTGATVCK
jgi:hypothetical protein